MEDVIRVDSVERYNELFGLETRHPLVAVVDQRRATRWPTHFTLNYGVYALFLKQTMCGDLRYGQQTYDYHEGTVVSFAPGQVVVDVGTNVTPEGLRGDVDFAAAESIAAAVSPVPGGVGRVTTAVLALHTIEAAERANIQ